MWILFMISSALAGCSTTTYFTECSSLLIQDVIISAPKGCGGSYPLIYKNFDCTYECSSGYFLDIVDGKQTCQECPIGSFNNGGGFIYGGDGLS